LAPRGDIFKFYNDVFVRLTSPFSTKLRQVYSQLTAQYQQYAAAAALVGASASAGPASTPPKLPVRKLLLPSPGRPDALTPGRGSIRFSTFQTMQEATPMHSYVSLMSPCMCKYQLHESPKRDLHALTQGSGSGSLARPHPARLINFDEVAGSPDQAEAPQSFESPPLAKRTKSTPEPATSPSPPSPLP
jgi:hypothetical protein